MFFIRLPSALEVGVTPGDVVGGMTADTLCALQLNTQSFYSDFVAIAFAVCTAII